jgi:hypothetical protein
MFAQEQLMQGLLEATQRKRQQKGPDLRSVGERRNPLEPHAWAFNQLLASPNFVKHQKLQLGEEVRTRGAAESAAQARIVRIFLSRRRARVSEPTEVSKEPDERQRWNEYLRKLDHDVASGRVSEAQCRRAREVWSRAVEQTPDLRHPTAGLNADGEFYFGWNYSDMPGRTLTLSFTKEGLADWFFRDKANNVVLGSENPVNDVPGEVFTFLRLFKQ